MNQWSLNLICYRLLAVFSGTPFGNALELILIDALAMVLTRFTDCKCIDSSWNSTCRFIAYSLYNMLYNKL